jgi:hypothetical protein
LFVGLDNQQRSPLWERPTTISKESTIIILIGNREQDMSVKIYTLENPSTGEIRYVGKTTKPLRYRLSHHKGCYTKSHKSSWIRSLDKDPVIRLVDTVPKDEWKFWEQFWIEQFYNWGFNLVNHTLGGDGSNGMAQSPESNKKRSQSLLGRSRSQKVREKISKSHKGKSKSKSHRDKISETLTGRKQSTETKKKRWKGVAKLKDGKIIDTYKSLTKAAEDVDGHKGAISNVCNGRRKTSAGYEWKYLEDIV